MERWADIPGFEGRYQVSDLGRVLGPSGRILRGQATNSGYLVVHLSGGGGCRTVALVHRLVARAFVSGADCPNVEVNHVNAVKTDNRAPNLEWLTRRANVAHAVSLGLHGGRRHAVRGVSLSDGGEVFFDSQLAAEIALAGRASSAIYHCLVGKKRTAYGYRWARA